MNYSPASLKQFSYTVLRAFGCDENEATIISNHLVEANLTGHDSHGVGMLPMYGDQVKDGNLIPNQTPELHEPIGAITVVDAKKGFGHHMTLLALDHAMKTIPDSKVAILGLRNAGHISRVGTYSEYCAACGYVSLHMVNVAGHAAIVAPFGASEGGFNTNPVSMALPIQNQVGPLLDMATSTVAFGKVRVAHNRGEPAKQGWIVDGNGQPTSNTAPMVEDKIGALSAFGGHKGSGLGIFAELMAGALAGTNTVADAELLPNGVLNNMLSIIIDPSGFDDPENIEARTDTFSQFIKGLKPATGIDQVLMPGDLENINRAKRRQNGIEVDIETVRQIKQTAAGFGVDEASLEQLLEKT